MSNVLGKDPVIFSISGFDEVYLWIPESGQAYSLTHKKFIIDLLDLDNIKRVNIIRRAASRMSTSVDADPQLSVVDGCDNTLGTLKKEVDELISRFGPAAKLRLDAGYSNISASIACQVIEPMDKYISRVESQYARALKEEKKERELLQNLIKKYGIPSGI